MTLTLFIIMSLYILLIVILIFGFTKMKPAPYYDTTPKTSFSIVVPYRNEAKNLPQLLKTFSKLDYPRDLFEVILVDDDSDEKIDFLHYKFSIQIANNIRKSNSPKKDAIETAIALANKEWIITTDADCEVQPHWLSIIDNYIQQTHVKMVAAGVAYIYKKGFLHAFQNLDFLSLQGATIGSFGINEPFMCNGANFAYKKDFFYELNGFEGNNTIASGDDAFLLQKAIEKNKDAIGFCLNHQSTVYTKSVSNWKSLFFQRVRWATKSTDYYSFFGKALAIVVFLTNIAWLSSIFFIIVQIISLHSFLVFIGAKAIVDYILLKQTSFHYETKLKWLIPSMVLYPIFSTTVAFYSLFGHYKWKGRTFKK
ncbi:Glycosyl transferase [Flavobacterium sp. 9AF]|uniref:glycosyltransferase family 2 protein n=1 Tax=Flavobacterium sp. 9AF TaxID=2653142 RepID=UPI0012F32A3B|nr:glycosyltransferase [Flavobacterium sp. 9AF]VXC35125.1 Glycosyl transferase [Flavobacterium sp. 9AF]